MKHLAPLRQWLEGQKENWPTIARDTGLSVKTLSRIVNDEAYGCRLQTFVLLDALRTKTTRKKAVPA